MKADWSGSSVCIFYRNVWSADLSVVVSVRSCAVLLWRQAWVGGEPCSCLLPTIRYNQPTHRISACCDIALVEIRQTHRIPSVLLLPHHFPVLCWIRKRLGWKIFSVSVTIFFLNCASLANSSWVKLCLIEKENISVFRFKHLLLRIPILASKTYEKKLDFFFPKRSKPWNSGKIRI